MTPTPHPGFRSPNPILVSNPLSLSSFRRLSLSLEINMPRRSSGGRSARAPARAPARNPPAPVNRAPPPAPVQSSGGSMLGGIGSTIAQGMAFGTGSAVAHRAVDAVVGPRTIQHETVPAASGPESAVPNTSSLSDACGMHSRAFTDCLNTSGSDISKCQFYMDMLAECRKNSGLAV